MKLLTKELEKRFAQVGSQDSKSLKDITVIAHYFSPYTNSDWWCYEYYPETQTFMAFVCLNSWYDMAELGSVALAEFVRVNEGRAIPPIERDLHWTEQPLKPIMDKIHKGVHQ